MRILILLVLVVNVINTYTARCQTLIPRVGFTFSTASDYIKRSNDDPKIKFSTGYLFGVGYEIPIGSGDLSIIPELLWIRKGQVTELKPTTYYWGDSDDDFSIYSSKDRYEINYLEMPISVKLRLNKAKEKFFVIGGLSFGYGLSGKWYYSYTLVENMDIFKSRFTYDIEFEKPPKRSHSSGVYLDKKLDIGMQVGFGVLIQKIFRIEARFSHSIVGINNYESTGESTFRYRVIQLSAGMPISIRKKE